jgi:allantoin racemase
MSTDDAMRIAWHVTLTRDSVGRMDDPEPLWETMRSYAEKVTGGSTQVELRFIDESASGMHYPLISLLNAAILGADLRQAERDGVDAVLIAAAGEPGLLELRTAVAIPVVGSVEAGLATSVFVGSRAGIVTINAAYADIMRRNAVRYGLGDRLIAQRPVQHFDMTWPAVEAALNGDAEELLTGFTSACAALVADGADVIVGAAQIFGAVLEHVGYRDHAVPYVDGAAAGLKAAESLVQLRRTLGLEGPELASSALRKVPAEPLDQAYGALSSYFTTR